MICKKKKQKTQLFSIISLSAQDNFKFRALTKLKLKLNSLDFIQRMKCINKFTIAHRYVNRFRMEYKDSYGRHNVNFIAKQMCE